MTSTMYYKWVLLLILQIKLQQTVTLWFLLYGKNLHLVSSLHEQNRKAQGLLDQDYEETKIPSSSAHPSVQSSHLISSS